jgi:hypothetical protein
MIRMGKKVRIWWMPWRKRVKWLDITDSVTSVRIVKGGQDD